MKIALIGYGKMGKAIEEIALNRGHEIVLKISIDNTEDFTKEALQKADVAIEFTGPESAYENILKCFDAGISVVCGSTGWIDKLPIIKEKANEKNVSFLYASNFSVGVNLFFELNSYLAKLMHPHNTYTPSLIEIHHTEKKDAPSGTAITLAEQILATYQEKTQWINEASTDPNVLPIVSERVDPAPGTHKILYSSRGGR